MEDCVGVGVDLVLATVYEEDGVKVVEHCLLVDYVVDCVVTKPTMPSTWEFVDGREGSFVWRGDPNFWRAW